METILTLVIFVFGVLQIILFFKIWGMTNDVKTITYYLKLMQNKQRNTMTDMLLNEVVEECNIAGFEVGDLVVDKNDVQWRIIELKGNSVVCKNSTKGIVEFKSSELRSF